MGNKRPLPIPFPNPLFQRVRLTEVDDAEIAAAVAAAAATAAREEEARKAAAAQAAGTFLSILQHTPPTAVLHQTATQCTRWIPGSV